MLVRAVLTPPLCPLWVPSWPHRRRFTQCPSESLPVSYGPGAGPLVRPPPVLFLRLPRGGWYGVSMYPASSHTRTVCSFVGSPRLYLMIVLFLLFIRFLPWGTFSSVGAGNSRGRCFAE